MNTSAVSSHQEVLRLMRAGDWSAARAACQRLNAQYPTFAAGWHCASHIAITLGAPDALEHIARALALEPGNPRFLLHRAHCLVAAGRLPEASAVAQIAQSKAAGDAALLDAIGGLYSRANDQTRALSAYEQAVALAPNQPQFIFNRAAVRRYLGALTEAEADYDRVIALKPDDFEAYRNRSDLRTQTPDRNHVLELEGLIARGTADWRGSVQLRYALAKEYEDLAEYAKSFQHLQHGAQMRRAHLRYDVAVDVATVDWIIEAFPQAHASGTQTAGANAPIFIVGLPRSGTTLVDRILGSHSLVSCAGELHDMALAIVAAARRQSGRTQLSRRELVAYSAQLDFAALGRDYLDRVRRAGVSGGRFTDKMPLNYLYCGLIGRALPNAKIVHVSRGPTAACYAVYKTLFEDGYPFSYDLSELAQYYVAYRRLMQHWQSTMPANIYPLSYEALVADQRGETRKLLQFCALEWEDACAEFHRNPSPTTTASASQVRRRIYDSSVSQWRHYAHQLAGLRAQLQAAGVPVEVAD